MVCMIINTAVTPYSNVHEVRLGDIGTKKLTKMDEDLIDRVKKSINYTLFAPPSSDHRTARVSKIYAREFCFAFRRATNFIEAVELLHLGPIIRFFNTQTMHLVFEVDMSCNHCFIRTYFAAELSSFLSRLFFREEKQITTLFNIRPEKIFENVNPICIPEGFWGKITKEEGRLNAIGTRDIDSCTGLAICGEDQLGKSSVWLSHLLCLQNTTDFLDQVRSDVKSCKKTMLVMGKKADAKKELLLTESLIRKIFPSASNEIFVDSGFLVVIGEDNDFVFNSIAPRPEEKKEDEYEKNFDDLNCLIGLHFDIKRDFKKNLFVSFRPPCYFNNNRYTGASFIMNRTMAFRGWTESVFNLRSSSFRSLGIAEDLYSVANTISFHFKDDREEKDPYIFFRKGYREIRRNRALGRLIFQHKNDLISIK